MNAAAKKTDRSHKGHRERLLEAAMVCLRERGYANTTARDLVRESDTNLGSIPYHFGSKEALLNEAVARGMDLWTREIERVAFTDADVPFEDRLTRALAAMVDRFDELRPSLLAFVEAFPPAVRSDELRAGLAAGYARARGAGAEMIERTLGPGLAPGQAATLSSVVLALCDGLILQWLLDPEAVPRSDEIVGALAATRRRW